MALLDACIYIAAEWKLGSSGDNICLSQFWYYLSRLAAPVFYSISINPTIQHSTTLLTTHVCSMYVEEHRGVAKYINLSTAGLPSLVALSSPHTLLPLAEPGA